MVLEVRANVEATSVVTASLAILRPSEQGDFFREFLEILFKITLPWSRCLLFIGLLGVIEG